MNTIMDNKIRFITNSFGRLLVRLDSEDIDEIYNDVLDIVNEETMEKLMPKQERDLSASFEHLLHDGTNCQVNVSCKVGRNEYEFGSEDIEVYPEAPSGFEYSPIEFDLLSDEDKDSLEQACLFALIETNEDSEHVNA